MKMTFLGYEWYNDLYMFPTYLFGLIGYFFLLFASIFFHELGHLLYFRKIGKKMKLQFVFGTIWDMGFQTGVEKERFFKRQHSFRRRIRREMYEEMFGKEKEEK